jgi:hypothetical protein
VEAVVAGHCAYRGGIGEDEFAVSRGLGRCERRIVAMLEKSPAHQENRVELERVLVGLEGFDESNVLRSIRSLARRRYVIFEDAHRKENSFVRLLPKIEPIPESWVFEKLAELGGT